MKPRKRSVLRSDYDVLLFKKKHHWNAWFKLQVSSKRLYFLRVDDCGFHVREYHQIRVLKWDLKKDDCGLFVGKIIPSFY